MLTPKVLLVNDDPASLLALKSLLADAVQRSEYDVVTARSGEEALRQVLNHEFAVIVLDVRMPLMDGFETAQAIHSHPRSASVPIIFVTAHYSDEINRLKGYQKGAVDYLFTPIIPQILQTKIAVFADLKRKNLQLRLKTEELATLNQDLRVQRLRDLERLNAELAAEVVERKKAEEREHELATKDPLTGVLNRRSLIDQLERAIVKATRRKEQFALLFLDLDKFKAINDALGHDVGDELLRQVAARLLEAGRESDVVARLGGDEFVVQLEGLTSSTMAANVAKKISKSLSRDYDVLGHCVKTSASIGIGLYPQDGDSVPSLMNKADRAMYHAKSSKRGGIQFFHDELNTREREHHRFKLELQHALKGGELELHYQPRVEVDSGDTVALQTMLCWRHPRLGLIAAQAFMPQVSDKNQLAAIGEWVISSVCSQARRWCDTRSPLSKLPLALDGGIPYIQDELPRAVLKALRQEKLPPSCLQIDVSESMLLRDADQVMLVLREFRKAGITLAVDRFGIGYSSLTRLKSLPFSVLKIDQSLIEAMGSEGDETVMVGAIIGVARAFALRVVAEGVRSAAQLAALKALGCDECQGPFFSAPALATELELRVQATTVRRPTARRRALQG